MSEEIEEIIAQLEQSDERSEQFFQKCRIRSAMQLARESTRQAKNHHLVIHYMRALFDQMRFGHGMLDPKVLREVAVELVLLLEDEEQARRMEPNLDEASYNWLCSWMSTCAYDNLAEATGTMCGYNSSGMHECISDGIQICRQTGKLDCIKCFREYASDVYLAADDFAMVRHQCQSLLEFRGGATERKDRRWSGHHKLGKLLLIEGRYARAVEELEKAIEMTQAEEVYLKLRAKLMIAATLDEANILAGRERFDWEKLQSEIPEPGEWPYFELQRDQAEALSHVACENYESAIELLTGWDRRLTGQNCLKDWFEIRLRLIAAYLFNGKQKRAQALAKGLEAQAHESQDFLTLRRLKLLMDENTPTSPIAGIVDGHAKSISPVSTEESEAETAVETEENSQELESSETPLGGFLADSMERMSQIGSDDVREELFEQFLSQTPGDIEDPRDAAYLVHLSQFLVQGSEQARRIWQWAVDIVKHFPDHAKVLSVVAALGHYFRSADPTEFDRITDEQLEEWFQLSMKLNLDDAQNYARAGRYYYEEGNTGEAERCFSRAFRLDRKDERIVNTLADLYRDVDRPRDALAVLDLSLREGSESQDVAWEAAMTALQLEQFESLLTYLDRFLELGEPQAWLHYYRAVALHALGRHEESLAAIEQETDFEVPKSFHLDVIRVNNLIPLGRDDEARTLLQSILETPLSSIDYLSMNGLIRLLGQLWNTLQTWPEEDPFRLQLEQRLLISGLMPDDYFEDRRTKQTESKVVRIYRIRIHQPLDESWGESQGCLFGQSKWTDYDSEWGVLAETEQQAVESVLEYQSLCATLPVEIVDVLADDQEYRDLPGVVWQGVRWSQGDLENLQIEDGSEDEFFAE